MFFTANCFTLAVAGNQRIQAWAKTSPEHREEVLDAMKPKQAKQIHDLVEILGTRPTEELALEGRAVSSVGNCVRAVLSWCNNWGYRKPSPERIARWIIEHKASRDIDSIARNAKRKSTEAVVNAIHANRPLRGPKR